MKQLVDRKQDIEGLPFALAVHKQLFLYTMFKELPTNANEFAEQTVGLLIQCIGNRFLFQELATIVKDIWKTHDDGSFATAFPKLVEKENAVKRVVDLYAQRPFDLAHVVKVLLSFGKRSNSLLQIPQTALQSVMRRSSPSEMSELLYVFFGHIIDSQLIQNYIEDARRVLQATKDFLIRSLYGNQFVFKKSFKQVYYGLKLFHRYGEQAKTIFAVDEQGTALFLIRFIL